MKTYSINGITAVYFGKRGVHLDIEDDVDIKPTPPNYTLLYKRLDGVINTYKINSISFMNSQVLKAIVADKGWRSFRTNRVISLVPIK